MKKLLAVLLVAAFAMPAMAADDAPKTKQVCKDSKDAAGKVIKNKDGSVKQVCKTIKIHKKHEGTVVPEKTKK